MTFFARCHLFTRCHHYERQTAKFWFPVFSLYKIFQRLKYHSGGIHLDLTAAFYHGRMVIVGMLAQAHSRWAKLCRPDDGPPPTQSTAATREFNKKEARRWAPPINSPTPKPKTDVGTSFLYEYVGIYYWIHLITYSRDIIRPVTGPSPSHLCWALRWHFNAQPTKAALLCYRSCRGLLNVHQPFRPL